MKEKFKIIFVPILLSVLTGCTNRDSETILLPTEMAVQEERTEESQLTKEVDEESETILDVSELSWLEQESKRYGQYDSSVSITENSFLPIGSVYAAIGWTNGYGKHLIERNEVEALMEVFASAEKIELDEEPGGFWDGCALVCYVELEDKSIVKMQLNPLADDVVLVLAASDSDNETVNDYYVKSKDLTSRIRDITGYRTIDRNQLLTAASATYWTDMRPEEKALDLEVMQELITQAQQTTPALGSMSTTFELYLHLTCKNEESIYLTITDYGIGIEGEMYEFDDKEYFTRLQKYLYQSILEQNESVVQGTEIPMWAEEMMKLGSYQEIIRVAGQERDKAEVLFKEKLLLPQANVVTILVKEKNVMPRFVEQPQDMVKKFLEVLEQAETLTNIETEIPTKGNLMGQILLLNTLGEYVLIDLEAGSDDIVKADIKYEKEYDMDSFDEARSETFYIRSADLVEMLNKLVEE
jgi:hypothetical protein